MPNRAPESSRDRYELDPLAYMKIEARLQRGCAVVGFFHSHPDGPPQPSHIDLEMARGLFEVAREFYIYAIQSVSANGPGELACWRLNPMLSGFDWVAIE